MKKLFAVVLMMLLALNGIASADAPFSVSITIESPESIYSTDVIVQTGDIIHVMLGTAEAAITVDGLSEDGLNFTIDHPMDSIENGEPYSIGAFLLPEGTDIVLRESGEENPTLTMSWTQLTLDPVYEDIIAKTAALIAREENSTNPYEVSSVFMQYGDSTMGFYVTDLDQDGTPELLLGQNYNEASTTVFYDMFTLVNGELVHVFDGWERSRYSLADNGGIIHEGSSSAFDGFTAYYYFQNGELHLMGSVIYNENIDKQNPWFFSAKDEALVDETAEKWDVSKAQTFMGQYPAIRVELEPFSN